MGRQGFGHAHRRYRHWRSAAAAQLIAPDKQATARKANGPAASWRAGPVWDLPILPIAIDRLSIRMPSGVMPRSDLWSLRCQGGRQAKSAGLPGHLGLPRLRASAEPVGLSGGVMPPLLLSIAPLPLPTGIRDPASSQAAPSPRGRSERPVELATWKRQWSTLNRLREAKVIATPGNDRGVLLLATSCCAATSLFGLCSLSALCTESHGLLTRRCQVAPFPLRSPLDMAVNPPPTLGGARSRISSRDLPAS